MKEEDVLLSDEEIFSIASDEFLVMRGEHNGYSMAIDLIVAEARKMLAWLNCRRETIVQNGEVTEQISLSREEWLNLVQVSGWGKTSKP